MREICLSGAMSGNRKQSQVKPDCGGAGESQAKHPPGDYSYCACSRLYSPCIHQAPARVAQGVAVALRFQISVLSVGVNEPLLDVSIRMNVLLVSMPDYFEHMPPVAVRMPNGALTSLAGNVDPHHRVAVA